MADWPQTEVTDSSQSLAMGKAEVSSGRAGCCDLHPHLAEGTSLKRYLLMFILIILYLQFIFFQCLVLENYIKMQHEKTEKKMCEVTTLS